MPHGTMPGAGILTALGLAGAKLTRFGSGLINESWRADLPDGRTVVVQRVSPIFPLTVNDDIDRVTRHLESKGISTPRLLLTPNGELGLVSSGELWRVLTFMPGTIRDVLESPHQAREAGGLLARFHRALGDLEHTFAGARLRVHDTPLHLETLKGALEERRGHARFQEVRPVAEEVLEIAASLPELPTGPQRIVHGDPKISNVVFDEATDAATCFIDLDTVGPMPVVLELGDALRSWCNPQGENDSEASLSLPLFRAAVDGYAREAGDFLAPEEWRALPAATLTITVELAARFAADALVESYFSWDSERYQTAGEHNQVRARSQVSLARSIRAQWQSLQETMAATGP